MTAERMVREMFERRCPERWRIDYAVMIGVTISGKELQGPPYWVGKA